MKAIAMHGPSEPFMVAVQRGHIDRGIEIVDKFLKQKKDDLIRLGLLEDMRQIRSELEIMKVSKNRQ